MDPYVKKTAIVGCIKLFHMERGKFKKQTNYLEILYGCANEQDPLVVINSIHALNEILADKGGLGSCVPPEIQMG